MDELATTKKKEQRELRELCRVIFEGGDPLQYPELKEIWCTEYALLFTIFPRLIDARYGNYLHLPFDGSLVCQPNKTMIALDIIREEFRKKIDAQQKQK